jgi:hypothetical protein
MQFQKIIRIKERPLKADHAREQFDPGIRMGDSPVMLSRSEASPRRARQTLRCGSG